MLHIVSASSLNTVVRLDSTLGSYMKVPCWEAALTRHNAHGDDASGLCEDPLVQPLDVSSSSQPLYGGTWYSPAKLGMESVSDYFITASPAALLGTCNNNAYDELQYMNTLQQCGRTFDLDGLVKTIRSCKTSVDLSVMDFLPRYSDSEISQFDYFF